VKQKGFFPSIAAPLLLTMANKQEILTKVARKREWHKKGEKKLKKKEYAIVRSGTGLGARRKENLRTKQKE